MANKILTALTKNFGMKLLALFFSVLLWLVVYNMEDPDKTATFTTNVTVTNVSYLTDQSLCYEVRNKTNSVTFTVTAKRSYLERLEAGNFTATADLSKMVVDDDDRKIATVPIDLRSNLYNGEITYGTKKYLEITLENLMSKKFQVIGKYKGEVAEGCAVDRIRVVSPTVLKVSGPESIVKKVETVEAAIDVSDMSIDVSDSVVPRLLNTKGNEVDVTQLTLSSSTVTVEAKILNTKEVYIKYQTSGTPAHNYRINRVELNPAKVNVKGTVAALNALTSIDIPGAALNIEGASDDIATEVDISEYLPDNVELVDVDQRVVSVTVFIDEYQTRTYQVPTANITLKDIPSGTTTKWNSTLMDVEISGLKSDLDSLKAAEIKGAVSLSGMSAGEHKVAISLELDDRYKASRAVARLRITN